MKNTTKWQKAVLALVIISFILMMGLALYELVAGLTYKYEPPTEDGQHVLNFKPLLLIGAAMFTIFALIELYLGIMCYKGHKGAAIVLLVCSFTLGGYVGAIPAIIVLALPRQKYQTEQLNETV